MPDLPYTAPHGRYSRLTRGVIEDSCTRDSGSGSSHSWTTLIAKRACGSPFTRLRRNRSLPPETAIGLSVRKSNRTGCGEVGSCMSTIASAAVIQEREHLVLGIAVSGHGGTALVVTERDAPGPVLRKLARQIDSGHVVTIGAVVHQILAVPVAERHAECHQRG